MVSDLASGEGSFRFVFLGSAESSVPVSPWKLKGKCNFTLLSALPSRAGKSSEGSKAPPNACSSLSSLIIGEFAADFVYYRHEENVYFYTRWARHLNVGILINKMF